MTATRARRLARLAWLCFGLTALLVLVAVILLGLSFYTPVGTRWGPRGFFATFALAFGIVGALISSRRPQNLIGWLFVATGLGSALQFLTAEYAVYGVLTKPGAVPLAVQVAWVSNWIWIPVAIPVLVLLPMLFPQARLPSPRWRVLLGLGALGLLLLLVGEMFRPGQMQNFSLMSNPYGIQGMSTFSAAIYPAALAFFVMITAVSVAHLVNILRYATGQERQQLKWFTFAAFILVAVGLPGGWGFGIGGVWNWVGPLLLIASTLGLVAAVGMAILRYHLYDIDVIIRRTVIYALVLAALAGVYLATVIVSQRAVALLTGSGQNEFVTVLSTLAIAALFVPVRNRIQNAVDRRFYRHKYDAQKVLTSFAQTVRDETDLKRLEEELINVIQNTMQPKSASLWIAQPDAEQSRTPQRPSASAGSMP